jgi:chromosome segregation ATPase
MSIVIQEDFAYNKEKLQALINEFSKESSDSIQIALIDQILYFLKILHEDLLIMEHNDQGVNAKDIETASKKLKESLDKFKTRQENQEFSRAYQDLKQSVEHKDQSLQTLQLENAKLIGKLDSAVAELSQHNQNYSHISKKLEELEASLEKTQKDQAERLENLKSSLQSEKQASRSKEIEDFKKIQDSQDELIDKLQSKNSEQTLKIEELSLEKSNLISKLLLLNNTIERLDNEIEARSKQLEQSESKFEDFRRQIEYETNDEIINLRNSEE